MCNLGTVCVSSTENLDSLDAIAFSNSKIVKTNNCMEAGGLFFFSEANNEHVP